MAKKKTDQPADEPANEVIITLPDGTEATIVASETGEDGIVEYTVKVDGETIFLVEDARGMDDVIASIT